jgi:hypothetical protein
VCHVVHQRYAAWLCIVASVGERPQLPPIVLIALSQCRSDLVVASVVAWPG